jgi:hypothetical protein
MPLNDTFEIESTCTGRISYFEQKNDTIFVYECFRRSGASTHSLVWYRSINIGILPQGVYTVVLKGILRDSACSVVVDTFRNSLSEKLEVLKKPNSIDDNDDSQIKISPNIVGDELRIDNIPINSKIIIFDIQGRLCYQQYNNNSSITVNTSDWQKGIYVISVDKKGIRKKWRLVKE